MKDLVEIKEDITEEEIKELLPRNIRSLGVRVSTLRENLNSISPQKGNFFFADLIGRIAWQACATSNSILILAENNNDHGIKSLARKVYESYLLLYYLFKAKNKEKEIAKIMAYEYKKDKQLDLKKAISTIEVIIESFDEDPKILEEFKIQVNRKSRHWHWSGRSLKKIIEELEDKIGIEKLAKQIKDHKINLLNSFNENAHIDFCLFEDFLEDGPNQRLQYKDPNRTSVQVLFGYIGIIRLTIDDIIELLQENKEAFANKPS